MYAFFRSTDSHLGESNASCFHSGHRMLRPCRPPNRLVEQYLATSVNKSQYRKEPKAMPELATSKSALLTDLAMCVSHYRLFTPGIYVCMHVPVVLDEDTRIVPGLIAMVNHGRLKQCEAAAFGFKGPPNFVLDVFRSHEMAEYESRKTAFEQFGVIEYVAIESTDCVKLYWNRHDGSSFTEVMPDDNGVIKSKALPGLWIPVEALHAGDWWSILSAIEQGVTRLGHHEFQETLWHKNGRPRDDEVIPFDAG